MGKVAPRWTILLGENGVGKTTVLQILAAFERVIESIPGVVITRHGERGLAISSLATEGIRRDPNGPLPQFSINALNGLNLTSDVNRLVRYKCAGNCDSKNTVTITMGGLPLLSATPMEQDVGWGVHSEFREIGFGDRESVVRGHEASECRRMASKA